MAEMEERYRQKEDRIRHSVQQHQAQQNKIERDMSTAIQQLKNKHHQDQSVLKNMLETENTLSKAADKEYIHTLTL